jgi:hypothetical protein
VNRTRFPDLLEMTTQIHALGLYAGWYQNKRVNATYPPTQPTSIL